MPIFPDAAGVWFWAGWTLQWSYEPQSPSFLVPLVPLCPMWCTIQSSTLCPKLTFKIPLCLISFSFCKVSPPPSCMWEIMFWSVLHRKRLAEEYHLECYRRGTGGAEFGEYEDREEQCFVSSLCLRLLSSTAKTGVWKQIYWDH